MDFYDCETVVGYIVPSLLVVSHMGICCYAAGGRRLEFVVFFFIYFTGVMLGKSGGKKSLVHLINGQEADIKVAIHLHIRNTLRQRV